MNKEAYSSPETGADSHTSDITEILGVKAFEVRAAKLSEEEYRRLTQDTYFIKKNGGLLTAHEGTHYLLSKFRGTGENAPTSDGERFFPHLLRVLETYDEAGFIRHRVLELIR